MCAAKSYTILISYADGSRGVRVFTSVCVCVSVFCVHDISKTDAARITKLDMEMFHDESRTSIYFGIKRSMVKVTSYKNIATWVFALL